MVYSPKIKDSSQIKKERNSNLEMLRILSMLAIIAHHYVVNSGVRDLFDYGNPTIQQYFLEVWGMWGKTAINSFILISGYFMCKMKLTWYRYFKLLLQILFYGIILMLIFGLVGYIKLSPIIIFKRIFGLFIGINNGFTASFMCFYAFVPFYNKLIDNLSHNQFKWLIGGLLFVFVITSTFFFSHVMNEPLWYATLYFVAAYIRIYNNKYFSNLRLWVWISIFGIIIAILSVILITAIGVYLQYEKISLQHYFFVIDSNKFLAFLVAFATFMVAKNLPSFSNKTINFMGQIQIPVFRVA